MATLIVNDITAAVRAVEANGGAVLKEPAEAPNGPLIVGTEATLTVRPASPGGIHITDWAVSIARADGPAEDLTVAERLVPVRASVPAGPPRNVAILYRLLAQAIRDGRPARPSFADAVEHHRLLDTIQRASETGQAQTIDLRAGDRP